MTNNHISVSIRFRPFNRREKHSALTAGIGKKDKSLKVWHVDFNSVEFRPSQAIQGDGPQMPHSTADFRDKVLVVDLNVPESSNMYCTYVLYPLMNIKQHKCYLASIHILADSQYTFDHAFDIGTTTARVYRKCCKGIVDCVLDGFNGTIMCYGQTGAGKTYTMTGGVEKIVSSSAESGVMVLALRNVFSGMRTRLVEMEEKEDSMVGWACSVAYMEIYNEQVNDLLLYHGNDGDGRKVKRELTIYEDKYAGPSVNHLTSIPVCSEIECLKVLASGNKMRHVASTEMNDRSSRSHTIFRVRIEVADLAEDDDDDDDDQSTDADPHKPKRSLSGVAGRDTRLSTLYLVDLAGSEILKHVSTSPIKGRRNSSFDPKASSYDSAYEEYLETPKKVSVRTSFLSGEDPHTPRGKRKHEARLAR